MFRRNDLKAIINVLAISLGIALIAHFSYSNFGSAPAFPELVIASVICFIAGYDDIAYRNKRNARANVQESVGKTVRAVLNWNSLKFSLFTLAFMHIWVHATPAMTLVGLSIAAGDIYALWLEFASTGGAVNYINGGGNRRFLRFLPLPCFILPFVFFCPLKRHTIVFPLQKKFFVGAMRRIAWRQNGQ